MINWVRSHLENNPNLAVLPVFKRARNSIHFQLPDGSIHADFTEGPIHYKDVNNEWQPIDTSLEKSTDPDYDYMNVTNESQTFFAADPSANKNNVKFQKGDCWLTFNTLQELKIFQKGSNSSPTIYTLNSIKSSPLAKLNKDKLDQILYPKLYSNGTDTIDVQYTIKENRIQEEIILNHYLGIPQISQNIKLHNIYAKIEGKLVKFYKKGTTEMLWFVEPKMYEQNDMSKGSIDLHFKLSSNDKNKTIENSTNLTLTKIIDPKGESWLADPQRQYPVVIDPDFNVDINDAELDSLYGPVWASARVTCAYAYPNLGIIGAGAWWNGTNGGSWRIAMKFDTSTIGTDSLVTQINLKLTAQDTRNPNDYIDITQADFSAGDPISTANRQVAWDAILAGTFDNYLYDGVLAPVVNQQYTSQNLSTDYVNKTGMTRYGLLGRKDRLNVTPTAINYAYYYSGNATTPAYRPILTIEYTTGGGLISGTTVWGHDTGVIETNIRDFAGNWTGTGVIEGTGDAEVIKLSAGEYMESETVQTGSVTVTLLQNAYVSADTVTIQYRTGATQVACEAASYSTYSTPFASDGFVGIKIVSTL